MNLVGRNLPTTPVTATKLPQARRRRSASAEQDTYSSFTKRRCLQWPPVDVKQDFSFIQTTTALPPPNSSNPENADPPNRTAECSNKDSDQCKRHLQALATPQPAECTLDLNPAASAQWFVTTGSIKTTEPSHSTTAPPPVVYSQCSGNIPCNCCQAAAQQHILNTPLDRKVSRSLPCIWRSAKYLELRDAVNTLTVTTIMQSDGTAIDTVVPISDQTVHNPPYVQEPCIASAQQNQFTDRTPYTLATPIDPVEISQTDLDVINSETSGRTAPCTPNLMAMSQLLQNAPHLPDSVCQTVTVDGKSYNAQELLRVISRLKQDVRICTDRIRWLENELQQARLTVNARDRYIHKLRSVLDQKVESSTTSGMTNSPLGTVVEGVECSEMCVSAGDPSSDVVRVKKNGVSGESRNHEKISGLIHHPKDVWSSNLIREAIQNNDFLRHLESGQVEEIVCCMYRKPIAQGAYIIREGQLGDALYVVADGVLEVSKGSQLLGRMDLGRAFGELALLYNCNRTASVKALTNASVWTLDRSVFQQIMMSSCLHQHEEYVKFLKSVPALRSLSTAKMHKLADVLESVYYGPDEYIIREGEVGETFFIIQSGRVRVTKALDGTEETKEIRQLGEGDWFGEKALYTSENRSANVISMSAGVNVLCLDRSNFIHLIGDLNEIRSRDYGETQSPRPHLLQPSKTVPALPTSLPSGLKSEFAAPGTPSVNAQNRLLPSISLAQEPAWTGEIRKEDLTPVAILGVGGFGCVELVTWSKNPSRSFALKRMKKQHIVQTRQQEHICSERKIMLELRCPFICRLYCTYKDNKFVYMLMEACLGGELWTVLRNRGKFNDNITRFVIACVLEAFTYLHTQGIVYRDLKPENLLLDHRGYVKLCDFGFAKRIGFGKKTWTFCGTPEYVAPEIILNKGHDHSADYWSLGILIFELLTGSPPFTGSDPMKIYNVVLRGIDAIEIPTLQISRTATMLIKRLCVQNPSQRLGYGLGGIIDIKQHKYFQGFDWIGLHRGTLAAPIQPTINGPTDTSNFDKYPDRVENPPDELSGWDADF